MVKKPRITLAIVSPVSWSSLTSTQRMEKGGSRWAKPRSGGLEQLVTNLRKSLCSSELKSLSRMSQSQLTSRWLLWKPPKYLVCLLRSCRSMGVLSPEMSRCSSGVENMVSQSGLMIERKPLRKAPVWSWICMCILKCAIRWM
uniref:Uncharacterized protein n=1 Tax=Ixodes ricinus TaxID=34613 RepID=A0A6B0UTS3_IXORI